MTRRAFDVTSGNAVPIPRSNDAIWQERKYPIRTGFDGIATGTSACPSGDAERTLPTPVTMPSVTSIFVLMKQLGAPGSGMLGQTELVPRTPKATEPGMKPDPSNLNDEFPTVGGEFTNTVPSPPDELGHAAPKGATLWSSSLLQKMRYFNASGANVGCQVFVVALANRIMGMLTRLL